MFLASHRLRASDLTPASQDLHVQIKAGNLARQGCLPDSRYHERYKFYFLFLYFSDMQQNFWRRDLVGWLEFNRRMVNLDERDNSRHGNDSFTFKFQFHTRM